MKALKNTLILCLLVFFISNQGKAQNNNGDFFDILYTLPKDANTFMNSYMAPIFKGFGYDLNSGWYSTAKPHKPLGFDLSLSVSLAYIPASDDYFKFKNSDYLNFRLADPGLSETKTPTVFGPDETTPDVEVVDHDPTFGDIVIANMKTPSGLGLKKELGFAAIPAPTVQLGIGLIKNTDLKIRYVPDVAKDVDYSYFGLGLLHDITQWIPVVDKLPIDISVFGAFSKFTFDYPTDPSKTGFQGANQSVSASINGYTLEALVSKKISVLTVLVGLGYNKATSKFNINGTYEASYNPTSTPPGYTPPPLVLTDPIAITTHGGGLKATGGIRLQFAVITLNADYTLGKYNVLNAGLGLSFR